MLNPLLTMMVLALVFSHLFKAQINFYSVFLFTGLLPWQYFTTTITGSLNCVAGNRRIIEHLPIPKYLFILSLAFSNLVTFCLSLLPLFLVMLFVGKDVTSTVLFAPFVLVPLLMASVGASLFFATINVFFDDTQHLLEILLQALYYLTPIMYGAEQLPPAFAKCLQWNPMYYVILLMRSIFYYDQIPSMSDYALAIFSSFTMLIAGLVVFKRADSKFMYFI